MTKTKKNEEVADRRKGKDRRGEDRRKCTAQVAVERRQGSRRKVQRRRQIDPTTCERDYTDEEIEFMQELDAYKRASGRMFPTCSEILEVIRNMGYVRTSPESAAAAPDTNRDGMVTDGTVPEAAITPDTPATE